MLSYIFECVQTCEVSEGGVRLEDLENNDDIKPVVRLDFMQR